MQQIKKSKTVSIQTKLITSNYELGIIFENIYNFDEPKTVYEVKEIIEKNYEVSKLHKKIIGDIKDIRVIRVTLIGDIE